MTLLRNVFSSSCRRILKKKRQKVRDMSECSFCSKEIGKGKLVVQKTGKANWFCSSKCEINMFKLNRDPRNFKWASKKVIK